MATSKLRTEGYRAQVVEHVRKHPGVLSTDLRLMAAKFNTDEEKLSKTIWAARAAGLIVQQKVDSAKPNGPSRYWVPEEAPGELKAEVKLARELQKKGITLTELRKQQAEGTAKPAKKAPAAVAPQPRQARKSRTVEAAEASVPAPKVIAKKMGKDGKRKVSSPKLAGNKAESVPALVTPISLEKIAQQPSLFEEPAAVVPRAPRRTRTAAPAQTQAPTVLPQFAPTLDPAKLAETLQPFAGAFSDVLAQMVLAQTMQKVQQGLGGMSVALAQSVPQPQIPAPATSPLPPEALIPATRPVEAATVATAVSERAQQAHEESAATAAHVSTVPQSETLPDSTESEPQAEAETEAPQVIRRPVLHTAPAPVVEPRQPKILIVGLIASQAGIVSAEFHEAFDIRFADAETPSKRLETMAKDCDRVIIMANFISHSVQDTLQKHPGFERMHGGLTRVKDRLTELFIASEEAAA